LDAMALCLALAIAPLVPPRPDGSGWHLLAGPVVYDGDLRPVPPEWWYWDSALRVWRLHPGAFLADTPQQMACDHYAYVSPAGEEAADPPADIVDVDGLPGAPPRR
jgi:hypothetical protein